MSYRRLLMLLGSLPLLIAVGSYFAGEQFEVVSLRTFDHENHGHDTKLWVVDHEGRPWVQGVNPKLRWIERIRANPRVELVRNGKATAHTASIIDTAESRRVIDDAMDAKYGWLHHWHDVVVLNDEISIRLDPAGLMPQP